MKKLQLVFLTGLLLVGMFVQPVAAQRVEDATPAQVYEFMQKNSGKYLVLDVRSLQEFSEGHIEGAEFFPVSASGFKAAVQRLPKDITYIVYCRSGNRSQTAKQVMQDAGLSLLHLDGGIRAWKQAGYPVKK